MMKTPIAICCLLLFSFTFISMAPAQAPGRRNAPASILQRYQGLLQQAKEKGVDTSEAEALAEQSATAMRARDRDKADQLMRAAIEKLQPSVQPERQTPAGQPASGAALPARSQAQQGARQPVFLLGFTHHYNGPGGYYPGADEVRKMGEFFVRTRIPGTLFFDGILVERLQKEDPALIDQIRKWNLPLGYHGEETHGPYPVASELLGEVYRLKEAQGYQGPWSLTTGKDWNTAVRLVEERYSFARPYLIDEATRMMDRHKPSATDRSRVGGLKLVQQVFGRDVSMMTSHSLESAPEGYAFRRMSRFGFDQPAVPIALHALKIFRIGEKADQIMSIAGGNESIFWYMGRINCKGDENGEAGYHLGPLRHKLDTIDRTRPRLLLMGFSKINEAEGAETARYLDERFFPENPGSCWVTGDSLPDKFEPEKEYRPTAGDQVALARIITTGWQARPPDLLISEDRAFSLSDTFECLARALVSRDASGRLPGAVDLHPLYGPVAEDGASLLRQETSLAAAAIRAAAGTVLESMDHSPGDRFIPGRVHVGRAPGMELNAAEFLYAMAAALLAGPDDAVRVPPSRLFPPYADLLQAVFKPAAVQPVCYTQGQLWTVKPVRLKEKPVAAMAPVSNDCPAALVSTAGLSGVIRVVFASNLESAGGCNREDPSGADLYRVDFNLETGKAFDLKRLTSRDGPDWFPALSPDGRFVVYDRTVSGRSGAPARHELWQIDTVRGKEQLLAENARFPAFSGAGRFLYYSVRLRADHQLLRAAVETGGDGWLRLGQPQLIADQRVGRDLLEDPSPLPDDSAVVFHRKEGSQGAGLAVIPTGGGEAQALTGFDGSGHASVSPDGQAIACTRSRDGRILIIRRVGSEWQAPRELPVSGDARDYQSGDERFASVQEARHSYVEWVTPSLLLVTTHGADNAREFRFARLYLLVLKGDLPARIDLSAAIEKLAGKQKKDFCSASAFVLPQQTQGGNR